MKKKLAIFDMDGTLFDTRKSNYEAYKYAVEAVGEICIVTEEQFATNCFGRNYKQFLITEFEMPQNKLEQIHNIKCSVYMEYAHKYVKIYDAMFQLIETIRNTYYITLFTSASRENTYELLDAFQKRDLFECIITAAEVEKQKPNMEGCRLLMKKFRVLPSDTVFIDDSETCLKNAQVMGIQIIHKNVDNDSCIWEGNNK